MELLVGGQSTLERGTRDGSRKLDRRQKETERCSAGLFVVASLTCLTVPYSFGGNGYVLAHDFVNACLKPNKVKLKWL